MSDTRRRLLKMFGLGSLFAASGMTAAWSASAMTPNQVRTANGMEPIHRPKRPQGEWVGEGCVLPICLMTSDFRLFAIDRMKSLLRNLQKGAVVSDSAITNAINDIDRYVAKPILAENYKNEMEWREKQMRQLGWTEQEIEKAQAHYANFHKVT